MCPINQDIIEEANRPYIMCCGTQRLILFTFTPIISITRLSQCIFKQHCPKRRAGRRVGRRVGRRAGNRVCVSAALTRLIVIFNLFHFPIQ